MIQRFGECSHLLSWVRWERHHLCPVRTGPTDGAAGCAHFIKVTNNRESEGGASRDALTWLQFRTRCGTGPEPWLPVQPATFIHQSPFILVHVSSCRDATCCSLMRNVFSYSKKQMCAFYLCCSARKWLSTISHNVNSLDPFLIWSLIIKKSKSVVEGVNDVFYLGPHDHFFCTLYFVNKKDFDRSRTIEQCHSSMVLRFRTNNPSPALEDGGAALWQQRKQGLR